MRRFTLAPLVAFALLAAAACSSVPVTLVPQHTESIVCFEHPDVGHVCVKLFGGEPQWFKVSSDVEMTPELRAHLFEWIEGELAKRA